METKILHYYKPNLLVGFIVYLSIGLYLAKENWAIQIAIVGSIFIVIQAINKWFWKYKPFAWMFWVGDFSGTYEGELEFQYYDETGSIKTGRLTHRKIIKQTGDNIHITSFTIQADGSKSSESRSVGVHIDKPEDDHFRIVYHYHNEGDSKQDFPPHYGTDVIKFIKTENGEKKLSGRYYTERHPFQTKGQYIDLKKISNNLIHEF